MLGDLFLRVTPIILFAGNDGDKSLARQMFPRVSPSGPNPFRDSWLTSLNPRLLDEGAGDFCSETPQ